MNPRRATAIFWTAAFVDVFAVGIAWSAWKTVGASAFAFLVAVAATFVAIVATAVAGRILTVVTRASRRATRERL